MDNFDYINKKVSKGQKVKEKTLNGQDWSKKIDLQDVDG